MQSNGETAQALFLACSELTRAVTAAAPDAGLSLTQARVLSTLDRLGPTRVSHLAALEHCAQPSMTGLVQRLVDAGSVERTTDPADARAVLVTLTEEGRDALHANRLQLREPLRRAVVDLDPADVRDLGRLVDVLHRLTGAVSA